MVHACFGFAVRLRAAVRVFRRGFRALRRASDLARDAYRHLSFHLRRDASHNDLARGKRKDRNSGHTAQGRLRHALRDTYRLVRPQARPRERQ